MPDHNVHVLDLQVPVRNHALDEDHVPEDWLVALDVDEVDGLALGSRPRATEGVEVARLLALEHVGVVLGGQAIEADADVEVGHVIAAAEAPDVDDDPVDLRMMERSRRGQQQCGFVQYLAGCTCFDRKNL